MNLFPQLADSARLWIFALDQAPPDPRVVLRAVRAFQDTWTSHGVRVAAGATLVFGRFLLVAGSRADGRAISGCGIDALMQAVVQAADAAGARLLSPLAVHFRDDEDGVVSASRKEFRTLARSGAVGDDTPVLDLGIATLGAFRAGQFERPFRDSWCARMPGPAVQAA